GAIDGRWSMVDGRWSMRAGARCDAAPPARSDRYRRERRDRVDFDAVDDFEPFRGPRRFHRVTRVLGTPDGDPREPRLAQPLEDGRGRDRRSALVREADRREAPL